MDNERIEKLEARIAKLEEEVRILKEEKRSKHVSPVVRQEQIVEPARPILSKKPEARQKPKRQPIQQKKQTDWETLIGKVWLPRIFIFVLLLGLVFGFRIAVNAGWLNETMRIVIGFIVAGLFYFVGDKQIKKNHLALGKVLFVGFISTLMVTTFAMHILYEMISIGVAFPMNVAWIVLGLYLSRLHRSQAMGVMFAIAGYLIPFLVSGAGTSTTFIMVIGYELIYYLALLWFAVHHRYRIMYYVSMFFLHIVYLALLFAYMQLVDSLHVLLMAVGIMVQHEAVFLTLLKKKLAELKAFPLLFSSFAGTMIWASVGFKMHGIDYLFTLYVLVTTVRYGWLAYQTKVKEKTGVFSISMVLATLGVSILIIDLVENQTLMASLYLIQGALAVYIGYRFQSQIQRNLGYIIYYAVTYFIVLDMYISSFEDVLLWAVLIATMYALVIFSQKVKDDLSLNVNLVIALVIHVLFLLALDHGELSNGPLYWVFIIGSLWVLYELTRENFPLWLKRPYFTVNVIVHLFFIAYLADEFTTDWNLEMLLTTVGWGLYALVCVFLGLKWFHRSLRMLGIGLIFLTLVKLILFDLVFVSLTTRAILFVLVGLIGIVVSRLTYVKK